MTNLDCFSNDNGELFGSDHFYQRKNCSSLSSLYIKVRPSPSNHLIDCSFALAFYIAIDTDLADSFDTEHGQFTVSLATPLYFSNDWKVAVIEYAFMQSFQRDKELIHITSDLVESQLICNQEERLLITVPHTSKTPLYRAAITPYFK